MSFFSFLIAQGGALPNQPGNISTGGSTVIQNVPIYTPTTVPVQQVVTPIYDVPAVAQSSQPFQPLDLGTEIETGFGNTSIIELVQMFVVYAFIIAAALSAIFIFIGGVNFILSGGDDEKIKKAVATIRYSIVGLIVTILSFTFVTIIGRVFGMNFLAYISYDQIRTSIEQLVNTGQQNNTGNQFNPRGR
jgi:hypothetical protein